MTSAAFECAEQLNQLRNVDFGEFMMSAIDDPGTERLSHWTNLRGLFFNGCKNVTNAGLANFVEMPNLEELSLIDEGGGMVITDAGMVHVGKLKSLKYLMIVGMPNVTDAGVAQLHRLSNLENVVLHRTKITAQGLEKLEDALPDCRIICDAKVSGPRNVRCIRLRRLGKSEGAIGDIKDSAQDCRYSGIY